MPRLSEVPNIVTHNQGHDNLDSFDSKSFLKSPEKKITGAFLVHKLVLLNGKLGVMRVVASQ